MMVINYYSCIKYRVKAAPQANQVPTVLLDKLDLKVGKDLKARWVNLDQKDGLASKDNRE